MALIFCDSFDSNNSLAMKWPQVSGLVELTATNKRTGAYCFHGWRSLGYSNGYIKKDGLPNKQTLVLGAYVKLADYSTYVFRFYDGATIQVEVAVNASGNLVVKRNGTTLGTSANVVGTDGCYLEIMVYIADGTDGYVMIRKNGAEFYYLTGVDTKESANAYANGLMIGQPAANSCGGIYVDDLYLDDAGFLGDIKVECLTPSGAGSTTQWTPSTGANYSCVDEIAVSDADYVSDATVGHIDTYAMGNLSKSNGTVHGVQVNFRAKMDDVGARGIAPILRPASTDRVGTERALTTSWGNYQEMFALNPEDSAAWEVADINALEVGVKNMSSS